MSRIPCNQPIYEGARLINCDGELEPRQDSVILVCTRCKIRVHLEELDKAIQEGRKPIGL